MKNDEIENIKQRYSRRNHAIYNEDSHFYIELYAANERNIVFAKFLRDNFGKDLSNLQILEVGAGTGKNLLFFQWLGLQWGNIYANELLEDRYSALEQRIVSSSKNIKNSDPICILGDATTLPYKEKFDVVLQATVFSSILDSNFRQQLAEKMFDMLKPGGVILSYDFIYNNPKNPDVLKLTKSNIQELFSQNKGIKYKKVTLAPPIARRIGNYSPLVNYCFPFLRTHLVACIKK